MPRPHEEHLKAKREGMARLRAKDPEAALGWKAPKQRECHHHAHAILLEWRGRGEPVWPLPATIGSGGA